MKNGLGIQAKVVLVFATVTLVGGMALFVTAGWQLQGATLAFYEHDVQTAALSLANGLAEPMGEGDSERANTATLQTILERNRGNSKMTFTILDTSLRVLASTESPLFPLNERLPATPELTAALNGSAAHVIRSSETGEKRTYVAVPILNESRVAGVLRASAPMATAYAQARQKWAELGIVAVPIVLLTVAAGLWLGRALTRPIQQLHLSALRIADGAFDERVTVESRDEIGQLGHTFNFMVERINALLATQRSFVSNAAHELRSPLMSLKLRIEALQDPALGGDQRATYLVDLSKEIDHMSTLIGQLLVLARLDEGRHQTGEPPGDIVAFFQDSARTWRIRAQGVGLSFDADIPAVLPDLPVAASDLQIVLDNLIGNATKYTPSGGNIWLTVRSDDRSRTLRVTVRDNGEGFSAEDQITLFGRFARLSRVRDREIPGTGLGLAIVKAVLGQYGGTITAHSDGPQQGATFEVIFPLAAL